MDSKDDLVRRDAYMKGLQLKNSGLGAETIYARLEKQGIPAELAKQVAQDVFKQRQEDAINNLGAAGPLTRSFLPKKLIALFRQLFE
jgi:hypothetical protein